MKISINKLLINAADTAQQAAVVNDCESAKLHISIVNAENSAASVEVYVTDSQGAPSKVDMVGKATLSENGGGIDLIVPAKPGEKVFVKSSLIGPIVRVATEYTYE